MRSWLHKALALLSILTFAMLAIACQNVSPSTAVSTLVEESPLAAETLPFELPTLGPVPTPPPDKGVVTGKLIAKDPVSRIGLSIFLGDIIDVGDGSHAAFLNRETAPIGRLDATTGRFLFTDVPPGKYSLFRFCDSNSDERWTPGSIRKFRYSEIIEFYPDTISVRGGWKTKISW